MQNKNILLGITGGIAAYKCPHLVRLLIKEGANVKVIMTDSAKDFVIAESCIIMTEKDAIKCQKINNKSIFVLPVHLKIEPEFWHQLLNHPIFKQ